MSDAAHASQPPLLLEGRVAVVTGGGRGIGRSVCELFAKAGATVVVSSRSADEVEACVSAMGGSDRAIGIPGDVADPLLWRRIEEAVSARGGAWDILISCAGVSGPVAPVESFALDDWNRVVATNLTGTMLGCRTAVPFMRRRKAGVIINVSSGLATRVQPGVAAYSATKAALIQYSAVLAAELADDHVQVFALHPGIVDTGLSKQHRDEGPSGDGSLSKRLTDMRMLTVDQSARTFLTLAGGRAADFNGAFVRFDNSTIVERTASLFAESASPRRP